MTAHTPGPWKATPYSSVVGIAISAQPDPKHNTIILAGIRGDKEMAEANARLIAAAPETADALADCAIALAAYFRSAGAEGLGSGLRFENKQQRDATFRQALDKARAVIAKATGEKA